MAATIPDAIHLEVGESDFPTPPHVIQAAAAAATRGDTQCTPSAGLPALREALAQKVSSRNRVDVALEQILVTPGAIAGLHAAIVVLCDPGDQVLVPDPGWPNYQLICDIQGVEVVRYPLRPEDGYLPNPALMERLLTRRSKVLLLNSPANPTGTVIDRSDMLAVMDLADQHDLWVLSDEVYDEVCFRYDVAPSAAAVGDPERVVSVWSFSKTYAMTGWRVGYVAAPTGVASHLAKTQQPITAGVNAPAQFGALEAVAGPQEVVAVMRRAYRKRRDDTVAALQRSRVPQVIPAGAFYLWVDVSSTGLSSMEFSKRLLIEQHVAVTPGVAFGPASDAFVRMSLATESTVLQEGTERLIAAMEARW